ncbi:MAG: hypothetical protein AAB474_00375 [Patescibacteria group bacterium]
MPQFKGFSLTVLWNFIAPALNFIADLWWLWLFIISAILAKNLWQHLRISRFKNDNRWVLLEILIPREIRKSPKAMEQILNQIYSLRNSPENFVEKYFEGEVTLWWSLEVASFGGEVHFFIRTPEKYKNIIESNIYANYKDAEVVEVQDYVLRLPERTTDLYKMGMDLFGLELTLGRESAYPIRTYPQFEAMEEEKALDPISGLIEVLSKLKKEEQVWLQILIKPADPLWKEKGYKLVKKLQEKTFSKVSISEGKSLAIGRTTPGEEDIIKNIEYKLAKAAFETVIRYVYFAPRSIFNKQLPYRGVRGCFAQYSAQNMNYFVPNIAVRTMVWWVKFPFFFSKKREEGRKQRVYQNYRLRRMPEEIAIGKVLNSQFFYFDNKSKPAIFSSEEIATFYHLPSFLILTAPFIKRVEAKRMGPPAGLPIFGEEEEIPGIKMPEERKSAKK